MFGDLFKAMRPQQWVKNSFVLAPLVFSQNLDSPSHLWRSGVAFLVFCLASGAVYLTNDLVDRESDRIHPTKKNRPIASGRLAVGVARVWVVICLAMAAIVAIWLEPLLAGVVGCYFAANLAYSFVLKNVVFLDVSIIALGFLLRVLGGAFAIDVPVSRWVILCTFLLSLYLALGKRKHELLAVAHPERIRPVLRRYRVGHIKLAMMLTALVTICSYAAYTFDREIVSQFGTEYLPFTLPFIFFGLWRFYRLTQRSEHPESPTEQIIRDPVFIANLVIWAGVTLGLIYG